MIDAWRDVRNTTRSTDDGSEVALFPLPLQSRVKERAL